MRHLATALVLSTLACTRANPAFDPNRGLDDEGQIGEVESSALDEGIAGDGDGDVDTGDGDVDTGDGDSGDGDVDTGDGDGDGDAGDGDGDTGDGDGDGGDGDTGDPNCMPEPSGVEHFPFQIESLGYFNTSGAPSFAQAPENCHMVVICPAEQSICDGDAYYMAKAFSSGNVSIGAGQPSAVALQLRFQPGGGDCMGDPNLALDYTESMSINYWDGQAEAQLNIRMPCIDEYDVPIYVDALGSTFWDIGLTEPAALWE